MTASIGLCLSKLKNQKYHLHSLPVLESWDFKIKYINVILYLKTNKRQSGKSHFKVKLKEINLKIKTGLFSVQALIYPKKKN